jgi:FixJ family two-component response regulator
MFLEGILQEGVCDWMRKPVSRETLVQKVRTAVHLFSLRTQQDRYVESARAPVLPHTEVAPSGLETIEESRDGATGL